MSAQKDQNPHGGVYFMVALPIEGNKDTTWNRLREVAEPHAASVSKFDIPTNDLRVGTLDTLVALSDQLTKDDYYAEQLTKRLSSQLENLLENSKDKLLECLQANDSTLQRYLERFRWDTAKFNVALQADSLRQDINRKLTEIDTDMKAKFQSYRKVQNHLAQLEKKQSGSLLVRDVSSVVRPEQFVRDSEYLVTLLVVVPLRKKDEWLATYETLNDYVVPRSSERIDVEDKEFALFTVTVFRRVVDDFKEACRVYRFVVKDFEFNQEALAEEKQLLMELRGDIRKKFNMLVKWCSTMFSEAFVAWTHLKALRIFVESVLRYGLPVRFVAAIVEPKAKNGVKMRKALNAAYKHLDGTTDDADEGNTPIVSGIGLREYFPYVNFNLDIAQFIHS